LPGATVGSINLALVPKNLSPRFVCGEKHGWPIWLASPDAQLQPGKLIALRAARL
jgi:hypothetical protein